MRTTDPASHDPARTRPGRHRAATGGGLVHATDASGAAPRMAMSHLEQSLAGDEALVARFRLHWFAWFPMCVWIVVGFATLGLAWWLALYEYLRLKALEHGVTSTRAVSTRGIFHRTVDEIALPSIDTVEIFQGRLGRRLGFGSVRVTGDGAGELLFRDVADPESVKRRLDEARNGAVGAG